MKSIIERFSIKGLFGKKDVNLEFKRNVQIYIGENGLGKTTVLKLFYSMLTGRFADVMDVEFNEILIRMNNTTYQFTKTSLKGYVDKDKSMRTRSTLFRHLFTNLDDDDVIRLSRIINSKKQDMKERKVDAVFEYFLENGRFFTNISRQHLYNEVFNVISAKSDYKPVAEYEQALANIKSRILFFPTYRRIETDLANVRRAISSNQRTLETEWLFEDADDNDKKNIENSQFLHVGMGDVVDKIENILMRISDISRKNLDALSADIIKHEVQGYDVDIKIRKTEIELVQTLLSREHVGLKEYERNQIMNMISSREIYKPEHKVLLFVINELLRIYRLYETLDRGLKEFVNVCNHYLNDKELVYDEVAMKVGIRFRDEQEYGSISFDKLSSGEKQLVSMMSEVYLEPDRDFVFLIDEPELSLSVFWQKRFIPDIMNSGRCNMLFAVTHSPYIFDNEYDDCAIGLNEFMSYGKSAD